jgi:hypothetical protein
MKYRIVEETTNTETLFYPQMKDGFFDSWNKVVSFYTVNNRVRETWYYHYLNQALDAIKKHKEDRLKSLLEKESKQKSRKIHYI